MASSYQDLGFIPDKQSSTSNEDFGFIPDKKEIKPFETVSQKSGEEIRSMSPWEQISYGQELEREQDFESRKRMSKGLLSGASFGATENIPGFQTSNEPEEVFGQAVASIPGIEFLWGRLAKPLVNVASKSPVFAKQLSSLARIVGWGEVGAAEAGLKNLAKGEVPSLDQMIEHGVEWAAIDTALQSLGLGGKFAAKMLGLKNPFKTVNKISQKVSQLPDKTPEKVSELAFDILNKEAESASKALELLSPKEVPKSKTELSALDRFGQEEQVKRSLQAGEVKREPFEIKFDLREPRLPQTSADKFIQEVENSGIEEGLNKFSERSPTEQQLGESTKSSIETEFREAEKQYTRLYEEVDEVAQGIKISPKKAIAVADEILNDINSIKTRPEGYSKVISTLNDSLVDMGYQVQEFNGKFHIFDSSGNRLDPKALKLYANVPLKNVMELGKRLNKIADYDIIGPSIKNKLKPVAKTIKKEIVEALPKDAAEKYIQAERKYGQTAERFGNEDVMRIRSEGSPEKIAEIIDKPSTFDRLKGSVSKDQFKKIERELLHKMNEMSYDKAGKFLREFDSKLSKEARDQAQNILSSKKPKIKTKQQEISNKFKEGLINEFGKSFESGLRPEKALKLWSTPKGRYFIKDALKGNPEGRRIVKYLKRQSFADNIQSFVKDGKIDFKQVNEMMKDRNFIESIRDVAGDDGVRFLRNLEKTTQKLERNFNLGKSIKERGERETGKGKELIKKAKERNLVEKVKRPKEIEAAEAIMPKTKEEKRELADQIKSKSEKGKSILKRMVESDYPLKTKIDSILEYMGLPLQTVLGVLLPYKYGLLKGVGSLVASKYLYKLISNPRTRKFYEQAANNKEPAKFISALFALDSSLEDSGSVQD